MNHTHHSPFLQKLMVYAVTFDGQPPAVLTAERFLYAAFAAADGAVAAETAEEKAERLALTARLSAFGADGDGGHADIARRLAAQIAAAGRQSAQTAYLRSRFRRAGQAAEKAGAALITADRLADGILKRPNRAIGVLFAAPVPPESEPALDALMQGIDRQLSDAFRKDGGT